MSPNSDNSDADSESFSSIPFSASMSSDKTSTNAFSSRFIITSSVDDSSMDYNDSDDDSYMASDDLDNSYLYKCPATMRYSEQTVKFHHSQID